MKLGYRILISFSLFVYGLFFYFLWNQLFFFALPILGIVYTVFGGGKHA